MAARGDRQARDRQRRQQVRRRKQGAQAQRQQERRSIEQRILAAERRLAGEDETPTTPAGVEREDLRTPGILPSLTISVLAAIGIAVSWTIAARPDTDEIGWMLWAWIGIPGGAILALGVVVGIEAMDRRRWLIPDYSVGILPYIPVIAALGTLSLFVSGRGYAQVVELGSGEASVVMVLFTVFAIFCFGGILGVVVLLVIPHPISMLIAAFGSEETYRRRRGSSATMPTRATAVAAAVLLLAGVAHTICVVVALGAMDAPEPEGRLTPIGRAVNEEIFWMTSGDLSLPSLLAWLSLIAGLVGIVLWIRAATRIRMPVTRESPVDWPFHTSA